MTWTLRQVCAPRPPFSSGRVVQAEAAIVLRRAKDLRVVGKADMFTAIRLFSHPLSEFTFLLSHEILPQGNVATGPLSLKVIHSSYF